MVKQSHTPIGTVAEEQQRLALIPHVQQVTTIESACKSLVGSGGKQVRDIPPCGLNKPLGVGIG